MSLRPEDNEADFKRPFYTDYAMPAAGQVTVPAEGGLIFPMKKPTILVNGAAISTLFCIQVAFTCLVCCYLCGLRWSTPQ